ncbi:sugar ABC transporter ATP-binding protein [Billgrantia gudaonensis]|uniref:Ribose ABC transporter ATP-binding protein n=1 Tax=Billgrantia gudaonensis TaxID=376427 RepID=A0A1G8MI18_9GAMM|nr:sugar ABC transporter ATP-binding protein [Halomonas gudaonensis]SDI67688.1 ribose ABC transporter ATP-binding protein [Halomonas gudaonensis]
MSLATHDTARPDAAEPLMTLQGIGKSFGGVSVLENVDFSLFPGRVLGLAGENGAGKSTLMKVLSGVHQADAGTLTLRGRGVRFATPRQAMDAGIAIIHQELNLVPTLSAGENIFLGREPQRWGRIDWKRLFGQAAELLESLEQSIDPRIPVARLSIGQQQMVEIARALSLDAEIIVMDEPTDALTDVETAVLERVVRTLRGAGKSLVLITHRLVEIFRMCDDVAVLRDGRLVHQGPTASSSEDQLIQRMVGRELADRYPYEPPRLGETVLEVKDMVAPGVRGVSFSARAGEVLGFGGLMGAGRTEMCRALCGDVPRKSGEVWIHGRRVRFVSPGQGLRAGVAYVPEDRKQSGLVLDHSVADNMSLTALPAFCGPLGIVRHARERAAVDHYIEAFRIKLNDPRQRAQTLSGGNQQKVSLAKALMSEPEVVILDEPTRGVDVGAKREIYLLINRLKRQGKCVLLISSEMPELMGLSDRIIVLANGRVSGEFLRDDATQEKIMTAAAAAAPMEN